MNYREAKQLFDRAYWSMLLEPGNVTQASQIAGVSRTSVYAVIHRLKLDYPFGTNLHARRGNWGDL